MIVCNDLPLLVGPVFVIGSWKIKLERPEALRAVTLLSPSIWIALRTPGRPSSILPIKTMSPDFAVKLKVEVAGSEVLPTVGLI
ncbi:Uncharacterised protein [Chlamydia abortus]|nr:Uncharacterised protein [Chlamydia abortus]